MRAALAGAALAVGMLAGCGGSSDRHGDRARPGSPPPRGPVAVTVSDRPISRPIPPGFLGLSFEYQGTRHYTGTEPAAIDPVLAPLVRDLNPGQAPVLRIGGDSTDASWWPIPGVKRPPWVKYTLTASWVQSTRTLA